jgi:hypothetical protein
MMKFVETHSQYTWFVGYALGFFVSYVLLDRFLLKIRRIGRNLFVAIMISLSLVELNGAHTAWGITILIITILFGDTFYYRYMIIHKPKEKKNPGGFSEIKK